MSVMTWIGIECAIVYFFLSNVAFVKKWIAIRKKSHLLTKIGGCIQTWDDGVWKSVVKKSQWNILCDFQWAFDSPSSENPF